LAAGDRKDDVAGADVGRLRRPARRKTHHHDLVLDLGRIEPEPWTRRAVRPAELQQIVKNRFEIVDRYDHVEVLIRPLLARALKLQRADAEEIAGGAEQRGAAPVRMRGRGEDRLVE